MKLKEYVLLKLKSKKGRFIFVGILNTIAGYAGYAFFCWIGVYYFLALTLAAVVFNSCMWNKFYKFISKNKLIKGLILEFLRFKKYLCFINTGSLALPVGCI